MNIVFAVDEKIVGGLKTYSFSIVFGTELKYKLERLYMIYNYPFDK